MKVGIIGLGIVGSAIQFGFMKLGHEVLGHDLKLDTRISDLISAEIVYICVPTPCTDAGECNTSIVESCLEGLTEVGYKGVVAVKSTVPPGTTEAWDNKFTELTMAFVPEILRERCAIYDFVEDNRLLAIGCKKSWVVDVVKRSHGGYPKEVKAMSFSEAELLKYYSNIFNAMRIIFANEMFEVADLVGADYSVVKEAFLSYSKIQDIYLDVNSNFRGYAGTCLPKDVKAIAHLCKEKGLDMKLFETIDRENDKFAKTVFQGMRQ